MEPSPFCVIMENAEQLPQRPSVVPQPHSSPRAPFYSSFRHYYTVFVWNLGTFVESSKFCILHIYNKTQKTFFFFSPLSLSSNINMAAGRRETGTK